MLFTTGAPVVSTDTADCVAMGTMSPTWSRALWLSSTTSCGEEMTLTLVTLCKALSVMTAGLLVNVYAKPGKTAPIATFATLLRTSLLSCCFKKNCVPYCSASLSVTSATVASTSTCSGSTSILRSAASIRLYSDGVAKISRALLRRSGMMRIPFVDAADCESAPGPVGDREDSGAATAAPCGAGLAELPSGAPPRRLDEVLHLGRHARRVVRRDRKDGVGLAGQEIDVEGADECDEARAHRGTAADEKAVLGRTGGDLAARSHIGLEHLGKLRRRGEAELHDLRQLADIADTRARSRP